MQGSDFNPMLIPLDAFGMLPTPYMEISNRPQIIMVGKGFLFEKGGAGKLK